MKFVIIRKNKSKVRLLKFCNRKDLVVMGTSIMEESIRSLSKEKGISREDSISIIKEMLDEKVFI